MEGESGTSDFNSGAVSSRPPLWAEGASQLEAPRQHCNRDQNGEDKASENDLGNGGLLGETTNWVCVFGNAADTLIIGLSQLIVGN